MCKYLEKPVDSGYNEEKNWKVAVNPLHSHITGNIYQIDVPLPKSPLRNLNAYLIRGKDRNLLIDTGYRRPECRAALEEGLRELNVSMDDTDIFLTHMHSDHSGLVTDIAGRDSRIFVSREDGERLRTLYTIASRDLQRLTLYQGGVPEPTAKLVMASPPHRLRLQELHRLCPRGARRQAGIRRTQLHRVIRARPLPRSALPVRGAPRRHGAGRPCAV